MVHTGYLPRSRDLYTSACHVEPILELKKEQYICSKCRKELNPNTIIHLYESIPEKYSK